MQALERHGVIITEVDAGEFFVGDLFQRKFASPPPTDGHHLVALVKSESGELCVVGYVHLRPFGSVMLVGGVCTDGQVIRRMPDEQASSIKAAGGIYFHILRFAFDKFSDKCLAYFGYCGDARAEVVNLSAGFQRTEHQYLLVYFHRSLDESTRKALIAEVVQIGSF